MLWRSKQGRVGWSFLLTKYYYGYHTKVDVMGWARSIVKGRRNAHRVEVEILE
jgi:hypothetical protein